MTRATTVQATVSVVAPSVAAGMASDRALPASVRPIIMATGPVMDAGRMVSTTFLPKNFTSRPAAMEIKAGEDDAELRVLDGLCGEDTVHLLKALGRAHAGDGRKIGKAGAVVQGDLSAR